MRIAVLTMTRDRVDYTKHCLDRLSANAGCGYDHYVLDQASQDGTREWLDEWADESSSRRGRFVTFGDANIGVCRGANLLLAQAEDYDVYVRFDNDCETTQPDTLRTISYLALEHDAILAPRINGLLGPPGTIAVTDLGDCVIDETSVLGGIFMAIPASVFEAGFVFDDASPIYGGDEHVVSWWRNQGHHAGYVQGWFANHYETTNGQRARYPEYFERKDREFAA